MQTEFNISQEIEKNKKLEGMINSFRQALIQSEKSKQELQIYNHDYKLFLAEMEKKSTAAQVKLSINDRIRKRYEDDQKNIKFTNRVLREALDLKKSKHLDINETLDIPKKFYYQSIIPLPTLKNFNRILASYNISSLDTTQLLPNETQYAKAETYRKFLENFSSWLFHGRYYLGLGPFMELYISSSFKAFFANMNFSKRYFYEPALRYQDEVIQNSSIKEATTGPLNKFVIPLRLFEAVQDNNQEAIEFLITTALVDINMQNHKGNTALHIASLNENEEIFTFLIGLGADYVIKNSDKKTAIDLCPDLELRTHFQQAVNNKNGMSSFINP